MFDHYKEYSDSKTPNEAVEFQWIVFDSILPDDKLLELMFPIEPTEIRHGSNSSTVSFYGGNSDVEPLRQKLRAWADEHRAAFEAERDIEREAKFATYMERLKLELGDPVTIEIPSVTVHRDGRREATVFEQIVHW